MYICGASLQKLAFYADTANPEASNSKAVLFTNPPMNVCSAVKSSSDHRRLRRAFRTLDSLHQFLLFDVPISV